MWTTSDKDHSLQAKFFFLLRTSPIHFLHHKMHHEIINLSIIIYGNLTSCDSQWKRCVNSLPINKLATLRQHAINRDRLSAIYQYYTFWWLKCRVLQVSFDWWKKNTHARTLWLRFNDQLIHLERQCYSFFRLMYSTHINDDVQSGHELESFETSVRTSFSLGRSQKLRLHSIALSRWKQTEHWSHHRYDKQNVNNWIYSERWCDSPL